MFQLDVIKDKKRAGCSWSNFLHSLSSNQLLYSTEDGGGNPTAEASKDLTSDDQLEDAYKEINDSLASDLLTEVLKIPLYTFEKFVVDLLPMMVTLKSLIQVTLEIQIYNPLQSTIYIHIVHP